MLGFSNFLNYRFEFEKKLKTFLELNANIKSLELFRSFKESISELRPLYLLKLICQKKKILLEFLLQKMQKNRNRKKNCSNMSIHCAVLWPDEHLKCKCSNYATTLVTLVAQQYVYNKYLCSLSPFMVSYPLPKSPLNHNGVKPFLKPHSEFFVICDFTRI